MAFLLVFTCVIGLIHLYLWRRLVHDTKPSPALKLGASVLLLLLGLSIPAAMLLWFASSRPAHSPLTEIAFSWLGLMFYVFLILACVDAARVLSWIVRGTRRALRPDHARAGARAHALPDAAAHTRRTFLARAGATSALVASSGIAALGARSACFEITQPEIEISLARFPRALDGYHLALISDVHIGPMLDGRFLRHIVEQTNRLRPDAVAVVGDLVDGKVEQIGAQVAELARLSAPHGVYFVTGNHEYYSGADAWIRFLNQLGLRVLMNEHVTLGDADAGGSRFDLAGIPDPTARHSRSLAPDARAAVRGRDPERELVLLAHQPVQIDSALEVGAGLQLSGHTHGGQLFPFGELTRLVQPYLAGLHRVPGSTTQIYVSCGTGFWGPPMRVLAPAEITQLRLRRA